MEYRPLTPNSQHPTPGVLLIQEEWPARALLKAELEEQGWQVLGADTVRLALHLSTRRGFRPDVVVVDALGLSSDLSESESEELRFMRGQAPLLVLLSNQYENPAIDSLLPTAVLRRPFTVGDVASSLTGLLASA
jgi:DNA-binding response OmpR family regulator